MGQRVNSHFVYWLSVVAFLSVFHFESSVHSSGLKYSQDWESCASELCRGSLNEWWIASREARRKRRGAVVSSLGRSAGRRGAGPSFGFPFSENAPTFSGKPAAWRPLRPLCTQGDSFFSEPNLGPADWSAARRDLRVGAPFSGFSFTPFLNKRDSNRYSYTANF